MEFDNLKDELLSVTDTGLKYAGSLDSSAEFEIFVSYQNEVSASISQGIVTAKDGATAGAAVRAAKGKRIGFAVASGVSPDRIKLATREALSIINSIDVEDVRFRGFSDPRGKGKEGAFCDDILSIESKDLIKSCEEIIDEAKAVDERIKVVSAAAAAAWRGYSVGNTRGILEATISGDNDCQCGAYAIEGEERRSGMHFDVSRERLYNPEGVGKVAAELAIDLLGAEKLDFKGKIPTIWTPIPAALFVMSSLARSALGDAVVEGISPLCDKIGDTVASKDLTIIDNGQSRLGLGTEAIDAEGQPQRTNSIIERGVLKNYLFDHYYGTAFGLESTGNCGRSGGFFSAGATPFEAGPSVSTKWMEVKKGIKSEKEIVESIDGKAVLIRDFPMGIFHSIVATGEFSCVAGSAYLVEKGEMKGSLEPVSIAGNYYEGFEKLRTIGGDNWPLPWGIDIPTLVFDDFTVVG
ncbi:MAG: TldD/PmbA family protein [Candidatus Thorarchaeota archaeon]